MHMNVRIFLKKHFNLCLKSYGFNIKKQVENTSKISCKKD